MINVLKAVIFGIVEGITEWLPVSSTGHMILLDKFIKLDVSKEFWDLFLVVIQFGAIFAVIILYWNTIWPIRKSKSGKTKFVIKRKVLSLWGKTILACIPAAIIGLLLDDWINEHLYNWFIVALMLVIVGIAFIYVENANERKGDETDGNYVTELDDLSYKTAFEIGVFQVVSAILPGTSRSGSTILGGLMLGVSRKVAAEFTFILAIPVMAGASILKIVKFMSKGLKFNGTEWTILLIGMVVAFLVSVFVIKMLIEYIRRHDFKVFGWYRIALGIIVMIYFLLIN